MTRVAIDLDPDLVSDLRLTPEEIVREMSLEAAIRWLREGRISEWQAARLAKMSRSELLGEADRRSSAKRSTSAPASFSLNLLGSNAVYEIDSSGVRKEVSWRLRKAFEVVAYLALAPEQRATKEEIVESVWPGVREDHVQRNFHPTLSEARRGLGHRRAILFRQGVYALQLETRWEVDALQFQSLAAAGRERIAERQAPGDDAEVEAFDLWRKAWALYRGPLLADLESGWVAPRREALRGEYLRLLRSLGELARESGRQTLALDAFRSVLLEEPYAERIHLAVMELYAEQGRRDLVRRQYVRLQDQLLKELNLEPDDTTQERYHELMR